MISGDDIEAMRDEPQTFDEWMDEIENFSSREERFWGEFPRSWFATSYHRHVLMKWMRTAYDVGFTAGDANK